MADMGMFSLALYPLSDGSPLTYDMWVQIIRSIPYKIKYQNPNLNSLCKLFHMRMIKHGVLNN
jgi:hypothetical protein